jgi:MFS transporter, SHS family, lactate transporter
MDMGLFRFLHSQFNGLSTRKTIRQDNAEITWGITLVLMLRSVGSAIFGVAADRYGRKWPSIVNNVLFIVLELATGFTNKYSSFLACRALFGIAMGGLYGNAAATAMEDCPPAARGIISGMFQVGCSLGYLLATVFARALVDTTPYGWRPLFWFGLVHQCCSYSFSSASLKQRAIKNDNV